MRMMLFAFLVAFVAVLAGPVEASENAEAAALRAAVEAAVAEAVGTAQVAQACGGAGWVMQDSGVERTRFHRSRTAACRDSFSEAISAADRRCDVRDRNRYRQENLGFDDYWFGEVCSGCRINNEGGEEGWSCATRWQCLDGMGFQGLLVTETVLSRGRRTRGLACGGAESAAREYARRRCGVWDIRFNSTRRRGRRDLDLLDYDVSTCYDCRQDPDEPEPRGRYSDNGQWTCRADWRCVER